MKKQHLFLGAALLGCTQLVQAAEQKTLKACMVQWAPFITVDAKTKEVGGPDTEALRLVAKDIGYDVNIQEVPWKRCLEMAKNGEMDIVYAASYKPERTDSLLYPKTPLHETQYVFVTKIGQKVTWDADKAASDFPQPVASVLGYSVTDELGKIKGLKVDSGAVNDKQNLAKLEKDRVKAILIEKTVLSSLLKADVGTKFEVIDPPFEDKKAYFITVGHRAGGDQESAQAILKAVDTSLAKFKADGTLDKIFAKSL